MSFPNIFYSINSCPPLSTLSACFSKIDFSDCSLTTKRENNAVKNPHWAWFRSGTTMSSCRSSGIRATWCDALRPRNTTIKVEPKCLTSFIDLLPESAVDALRQQRFPVRRVNAQVLLTPSYRPSFHSNLLLFYAFSLVAMAKCRGREKPCSRLSWIRWFSLVE